MFFVYMLRMIIAINNKESVFLRNFINSFKRRSIQIAPASDIYFIPNGIVQKFPGVSRHKHSNKKVNEAVLYSAPIGEPVSEC